MPAAVKMDKKLTEEEEMLKKKYEKLKRKKKALQNLNAPKQEPPPPKPIKRPLEAKPDAKEVAKKLLKSGAISAIKVENKERQGFKRPKALERKRNACERPSTSVTGYQPFSASHSPEDDPLSTSSTAPSDPAPPANSSPRPPVKKLYESFVSSRKLEDEIKEDRARDNPRRERDRDGRPERPRQGNTVYVRGYGVTQELLQKTFESVGNIINISMEMDKNCGFVTFEKIEQADKAIKEINNTVSGNIRLNVSLARRQPLIPPLGEDSSSSSWASLALHSTKKGNHEDTRSLIVYDDVNF